MKFNVYSIFDAKSRAYSQPFYSVNHETAGRSFANLANDKATEVGRHPGDYSLFYICQFDDHTGNFDAEGPAVSLGLAAQFKEVANAPE